MKTKGNFSGWVRASGTERRSGGLGIGWVGGGGPSASAGAKKKKNPVSCALAGSQCALRIVK